MILRGRQTQGQLNRMLGLCAGMAEEWWLSALHAVREGFTEAAAFPVCQGDKWISLPIREGRERAFQVEQETAQRP